MKSDGADDFLEGREEEADEGFSEEPVGLIADALAALDDIEDRMDELVCDVASVRDALFELGLMLQEVAADPRLRAPEA